MVAQPNSAAMATVISSTASTDPPILPRLSTAFVRVNAPTMATNTSGMTSMRNKIDIAGSHQRHPVERGGGGVAAAAQRKLDARAQHDAHTQGREHAEREAFILRLQIAQHRDERREDDQHGEHRPQYVERHVSRLPFSFRSDTTGGRATGETQPGALRPPVAAPAYSVSLIMRLLYLVVQWAYYAIFRQPAIGQTACKQACSLHAEGSPARQRMVTGRRRALMPGNMGTAPKQGPFPREKGKGKEKEGFRPHARRADRPPRVGPLGICPSGPRRSGSGADARPRRSCWRTRCCSASG